MRAFLLAGTASSVGKTLASVAVIADLRARGYRVLAAKAGPDFLDPGYLAWATDAPCANLDPWMLGEKGLARLLSRISAFSPDVLLCEGAMGLYDGGSRSTAALAAKLKIPVLLLVGAKGVGESIAALVLGFCSYARTVPGLRIAGILASHVGGPKHEELIRRSLAQIASECTVPYLGALLRAQAPHLASRHLGLVGVSEAIEGLDRGHLIDWLAQGLDRDGLVRAVHLSKQERSRLDLTRKGSYHEAAPCRIPIRGGTSSAYAAPFFPWVRTAGPTIAIALDAAFFFCYADLPALFAEAGFRLVFFSPLVDAHLPPCQGIYIPGGYPELYARTLSANTQLLDELRAANAAGIPIYAECGGFLYLAERLIDRAGDMHPLLGLIPGSARITTSLQGLGYRTAVSSSWPRAGETLRVRGHEFHYAVFEETAAMHSFPWSPFWTLVSDEGRACGTLGVRTDTLAASWLHVSPEGGRDFFLAWLEMVRDHARL